MTIFQCCPTCNSKDLDYVDYDGGDPIFNFWVCGNCGEVWSDGDDDEEFDDAAQANEAIAEQNIEQFLQWRIGPKDCPPFGVLVWGYKSDED